MSEELKRCPFCGGEAYIKVESDSFSNVQSIIRCSECHTTMVVDVDMTKKDAWNRQKAIEKWNNRPSPWHTGKPTEEGWYLAQVTYGYYFILEINTSGKFMVDVFGKRTELTKEDIECVVAYQKIKPYKKED